MINMDIKGLDIDESMAWTIVGKLKHSDNYEQKLSILSESCKQPIIY